MSESLTPGRYIRKHVFGELTQSAFGALLGYSQAHIHRWESGEKISREGQERIRALARTRGIDWDDKWFFEVPEDPARAA